MSARVTLQTLLLFLLLWLGNCGLYGSAGKINLSNEKMLGDILNITQKAQHFLASQNGQLKFELYRTKLINASSQIVEGILYNIHYLLINPLCIENNVSLYADQCFLYETNS